MHGYGGTEQLFYESCEPPKITEPDEVIVKLKAASVNHIDIWNRMGATGMVVAMPHILGADGAGVVAETGAKVENVKVGDAVCLYPPTGCGQCEFCRTERDFMCIRLRVLGERLEGTYAQYVKLPAQNCFPIPAGYSFHEAAAFPLVFITLWRMVITNAALQPGETMLIIGIGGGVASAALQVAKQIGARVIVTSGSDAKLERAKELGADHGVNHQRRKFCRGGSIADRQTRCRCRARLRRRRGLAAESGVARPRRPFGDLRRHGGRPAPGRYRGDRYQAVEDLRFDAWAAAGSSFSSSAFSMRARSNRSSTASFRSPKPRRRSAISKQRSSSAKLCWRFRTDKNRAARGSKGSNRSSGSNHPSRPRRWSASAQVSRVRSWSLAAKRRTTVRAPASIYFSVQSITSSQEPVTQSMALATAS